MHTGAPLFPAATRTDPDKMRANETHYGFLQRINDPVFEKIRTVFNQWFDRFMATQDETAAIDLRARFRAKQGGQLEAAFWELYLHELFSRLGFEIDVHPDSERGTRPDFELARDGQRIYLEAVMPTPGTFKRDEPGNVQTVIEYVEEAFDPKWRFKLRYITAGQQSPRKVAVQRAVLDWVDTLDWEENWRGNLVDSSHPEEEIVVGDWVIALTALPWPPENHSSESKSMIMMYRGTTGSPEALSPAILPLLTEKANKYGDLDAPLVIAVWVMDLMADKGTVPLALFGGNIDWPKDGVHPTGLPPSGDSQQSLWAPYAKHRGRASAVLAAEAFGFGYPAVARVLPRLWINPWANRPLEVALPFATSRVSEDESTVDGQPASASAAELFGLSEDWPGQPFQGGG